MFQNKIAFSNLRLQSLWWTMEWNKAHLYQLSSCCFWTFMHNLKALYKCFSWWISLISVDVFLFSWWANTSLGRWNKQGFIFLLIHCVCKLSNFSHLFRRKPLKLLLDVLRGEIHILILIRHKVSFFDKSVKWVKRSLEIMIARFSLKLLDCFDFPDFSSLDAACFLLLWFKKDDGWWLFFEQ